MSPVEDGTATSRRVDLLIVSRIVMIALLFLECLVAFSQQTSLAERISYLERSVMDLRTDPCVDFYQYACGNFESRYPLNPESDYVFLTDLQRKDPIVDLGRYLSTHDGRATADRQLRALHRYYTACTEAAQHDKDDFETLRPLLAAIDRYRTTSDLPRLLARLSLVGSMPFFRLSTGVEPDISSTTVIELRPPSLSLPDAHVYLDGNPQAISDIAKLHDRILHYFVALGQSRQQADVDADEVIAIEREFAAAMRAPVEDRDPRKHIHAYRIGDLNTQFNAFSWFAFFAALGAKPHGVLNVDSPQELTQFTSIIQGTPASAIRAYLRYRLVLTIPPVILPHHLIFEPLESSQAPDDNMSRSDECVVLTARARQDDLTRLYIREFMPPDLKPAAEAMVESIKKQLGEQISRAGWLDPSTRAKALTKLTQLSQIVAYDQLSHHYERIPVTRDRALQNYFVAKRSQFLASLRSVGGPVNRGVSQFLPVASGARYDGDINTIEIPAADWIPPSFDPRAYPAENYGRIGFTVGHELIHAFDDKGRLRDGFGKLVDWWSDHDAEKFKERSQCFVHEYEQFGVDSQHHENGQLTLGENIADNGGLHIALLAFLADAVTSGDEIDRPQKDGWTPLQRFFLSYAQETCSEVQPTSERIQLETNPHSLDRFRANGAVRNLSEFRRAFSCREEQQMTPRDRCVIW